MAPEPTDEELARIAEEDWAKLKKILPYKDFLNTWGPVNWTSWIRCLDKDPAARKRIKELAGEEALRSGLDISSPAWKKLKAFISEHVGLRKRVETEYRLQLLNTMRVAIFGKDLKAPDLKSHEWKGLYERLVTLLARHGRNDSLGKGDFFLVDDEVGEPGQKIELTNPDVLTPTLIADLQQALIGWKNDWYVIITLHFDDVDSELGPGMLVVWADHVDEAIDREQLKRILGPRFKL